MNKQTDTEKKYDLVIEVDGKQFGLRTTFNPDAGTPQGDIDIFDAVTGEYIDEMCGASIPDISEADEDNGEFKRIIAYIKENLVF